MEKQMESFKKKGRLSRRFSSRKSLGSLKTRFKRFLSNHHAKAGEAEGDFSASSYSDTDERTTSSPSADRSGEMKKSPSSSSSSDSDEGSPSEPKKEEKSDPSSDSSSEKKRKKGPSKKSSRKKLQVHQQQERQEAFRLPPLEETPPTSPQSNPRLSTDAQSDYGRLWTHASAPNSPANLAHKFNLNYRGGDSSPVALIHSLSGREPGKYASQLSEISIASPPSSSSLDLDVLGVKGDDLKASPSKTIPSLKPNGLPIVHHDEEQGVWRCGSCGWIYPNPNPSLRNRREHKRHCGEITNVQRWLGAQDIHDTPETGAVELEEDSEVCEGSGPQEKLSTVDEHPMAKSDSEDNHEDVSDMSTDPHGTVDQGRFDEIESNESPDHHALGDEGSGGRNANALVDPDEVDDQMKVNRGLEWPTLDTEIKDHSSSGEKMSNGSNNHHEIEDHSKLDDVSNRSTGHHETEEINKLDDSVDEGLEVSDPTRGVSKTITPEVENEKEPVPNEDNLEEVIDVAEPPQMFGSELEAIENQLNQKPQEEMEKEPGDVQVQRLNGNGKLEDSGQHSFAAVHSTGHDLMHVDNSEGLREEEDVIANQDSSDHLNHPHDTGLTEVPEVDSEQSVLTTDNGLEVEKVEPRVLADDDSPNYKAKVVKAFKVTEPSLSTANPQNEKEQVENKIDEIAEHEGVETGNGKRNGNALKSRRSEVTKVDKVVPKLAKPLHSQNDHLGIQNLGREKDVNSNGHEFPDHSNQHRLSEIDSAEGNSIQVSQAQGDGIRTESMGRLAGSPSPLEEAPKWVNSGSFTSQEEGDAFSSVQKYWADVTSSKYLLVEGKRSPSFGKSNDVGFPFFRNGEGRRSPSPFPSSKSEHGEIQSQSSVDSVNNHGTVEDKDEDRAIPSGLVVQHHGSSSSSSHMVYDFEEVVHQQNTHDLICPVCHNNVTKRIILRKRKRIFVPGDDETLHMPLEIQKGDQDQSPPKDESQTWGCLACLSLFILTGRGETKAIWRQSSVSGKPGEIEQERIRCLPKLFHWGTGSSESEVHKPLLEETAQQKGPGEFSEPPLVNEGPVHEVPSDGDPEVSCFSYLQRFKSQPPAPEIPVSTQSLLDIDESSEMKGHKLVHGSIPGPDNEPVSSGVSHPVVDNTKKPSAETEKCECLPFFSFISEHSVEGQTNEGSSDVLPPSMPASQSGASSKYILPPSSGTLSSHHEITEGHQDATATPPLAEKPPGEGADGKRSCNCLPELPSFSWGPIPVYYQPPLGTDFTTEIQPPSQGTEGGIDKVPPNDNDSADLTGKPGVDDGDSSSGSSHVEKATCMCIPLVLPAIDWVFPKGTTNGSELKEPLLSEGSDGPSTSRPEDSSSIDSQQTIGIAEPVILQGLEEGLQAPPARQGTSADPGLSVVANSPARTDLSGTKKPTESEEVCFSGIVSSHKIVTESGPSGEPYVADVLHSNYDLNVVIGGGQLSGTVENREPKPPETLPEISNGDIDSNTDSSGPAGGDSLQSVVPGHPHYIHADIPEGYPGHLLADAIIGQLDNVDEASSLSGIVSQPVEAIIKDTFPAEDNIEAKNPPQGEPKHDSCNCLQLSLLTNGWWGSSRGLGEGLHEPLLPGAGNEGAADDSPAQDEPTGDRCNCLSSLPTFSLYNVFRDHHISSEPQQPGTGVDGSHGTTRPDEIVVDLTQTTQTHYTGKGPTSSDAVDDALANTEGKIPSRGGRTSQEYFKSIVHGGLDVTLVSLGVVASGAGGDAKTITVIAMGLANLMFGLVNHVSNVMSLFYNYHDKFLDEVGQGFVQGCLSILSFLFFGALAPITFGFSFRNTKNRDYKMAATCAVALVSIVLLGAASAHVKSKSAVRIISVLLVTGFAAAIGGIATGHYVSELLQYLGFSSV